MTIVKNEFNQETDIRELTKALIETSTKLLDFLPEDSRSIEWQKNILNSSENLQHPYASLLQACTLFEASLPKVEELEDWEDLEYTKLKNAFKLSSDALLGLITPTNLSNKAKKEEVQEEPSDWKKGLQGALNAAENSLLIGLGGLAIFSLAELATTTIKYGTDGSNLDITRDFISTKPGFDSALSTVNMTTVAIFMGLIVIGVGFWSSRRPANETSKEQDYTSKPTFL